MDNYDLSNLPLSGQSAHSGENHPWLTDEENRLATFSRRSVTVSRPEQTELQGYPSTSDEQIPEQRVLADFGFGISLAPNIFEPLIVNDPEDPFAALAAYQSLTFNDDSQHPSVSELGLGSVFLEGFTAEDLTDLAAEDLTVVVMGEPEGNDVLELPEQSQGESDTAGIIIPESAIPDTDTDKPSDKRRAPEPTNLVIGDLPESVIKESSRRSDRLTRKRQKLGSTDTEFLSLPRGTATESQVATMPKKSATSRKKIRRQNLDEPLRDWVEKETDQWVMLRNGKKRKFGCSYPDCGFTTDQRNNLQKHIFKHTGISVYKCTYPECGDSLYFRTRTHINWHVQLFHNKEKLYQCTLCGKRFGRKYNCQRHMRNAHKMSL